jgi:hypothetical protein
VGEQRNEAPVVEAGDLVDSAHARADRVRELADERSLARGFQVAKGCSRNGEHDCRERLTVAFVPHDRALKLRVYEALIEQATPLIDRAECLAARDAEAHPSAQLRTGYPHHAEREQPQKDAGEGTSCEAVAGEAGQQYNHVDDRRCYCCDETTTSAQQYCGHQDTEQQDLPQQSADIGGSR